MISHSILPPGIRIGAGIDVAERPAVRIDVRLAHEEDALAIVVNPIAARAVGHVLIGQADRRVRALGALLLRQADLVEGRAGTAWGLRLVGGSEA
jgi:hypothetical protein